MAATKPIVLITLGYYLPGFKSGGPLKSILNIVKELEDDFTFKIITQDRDLGDQEPYPDITSDNWNTVGSIDVFYMSQKNRSIIAMSRILQETPHDILYINSLLNPKLSLYTLLAQRLGRASRKPTILAPRGIFSRGAMSLKPNQKKMYFALHKALGLYKNVIWHASTQSEADDINRVISTQSSPIHIAPDLCSKLNKKNIKRLSRNIRQPLKVLFLSRISPMKNLEYAIEVLHSVKCPIEFNIFGPVEDEEYWQHCQRKIHTLPENIHAKYHGAITPNDVPDKMHEHDLFFLPSRGENYGHVIAEALGSGLPVLISDNTPWNDVHNLNIGAVINLSKPTAFVDYIEHISALNPTDHINLCNKVLDEARNIWLIKEAKHQNTQLFHSALLSR